MCDTKQALRDGHKKEDELSDVQKLCIAKHDSIRDHLADIAGDLMDVMCAIDQFSPESDVQSVVEMASSYTQSDIMNAAKASAGLLQILWSLDGMKNNPEDALRLNSIEEFGRDLKKLNGPNGNGK